MLLNQMIAQKIVQRAMKIIGSSINVMDQNGIIIASGDTKRLHQKHIGAILAIRENRTIEIDEQLAKKWNDEVQPGINLPINYLGKILGVIGISGVPEKISAYAELVRMTAELIIEQHAALEKERWTRRYREEFIIKLLEDSSSHNLSQILEQTHGFNIALAPESAVIIIKFLQANIEKLQTTLSYLEQTFPQTPSVPIGLDQIAMIMPISILTTITQQKQINHLLPLLQIQEYKLSIGLTTSSINSFHLSYQTAKATLEYGLKQHPKKTIYSFSQERFPVLINTFSESWQHALLTSPLHKLVQQDPNGILRKTLKQYFLSNCDLSLSSKSMFIHINTLRYRISKIEKITGLNINKIEDKFILYIGTFQL
ncbi:MULTISPECIES: sugar diacid recognition domain-containing protein [Pasteurellaceae]|uniref:Putative sugar diacid recognition n=1 Tax=Pasteurella bettyae CCUG 2042 TaxID=1095749 RepID=I3DHI4_9PAST|nr:MULTISPECIES: sugar diacid recognition domain-containing protein [Pasteurellaceae]EIJ71177.1 putative sugar diacid recognition [Pasteurella bettyae CCUG 2042]SUB21002.1 Sugar diacid regulator [Pasteurella bettyae]